MAEHKLPKLGVAGSNPVARSRRKMAWCQVALIRSAIGYRIAGVRESGLCPLFLLPFLKSCLHPEKESERFFLPNINEKGRKGSGDTADQLIMAIQGFAEPLLADMGMELVEVQFRREGHGWVLRLFIDKEGGVAIDDCAKVSRRNQRLSEVEDLITHAYHLEVSSPGLERPLKKREDFVRFADRRRGSN